MDSSTEIKKMIIAEAFRLESISDLNDRIESEATSLCYNPYSYKRPWNDLPGFQSMKEPAVLYVPNNHLTDIQPIRAIVHLERLDIGDNQISDIYSLYGLKSLQNLDLDEITPDQEKVLSEKLIDCHIGTRHPIK